MKETINTALTRLLQQNLKKFCDGRSLDDTTCIEIYKTIYSTVMMVLENSNVFIANEAVNYIAQCYYDGTCINNVHELNPNIFDKRAKLDNISTKDLVVMSAVLLGTEFVIPIKETLKRRN